VARVPGVEAEAVIIAAIVFGVPLVVAGVVYYLLRPWWVNGD
jgi:hypothetical protein